MEVWTSMEIRVGDFPLFSNFFSLLLDDIDGGDEFWFEVGEFFWEGDVLFDKVFIGLAELGVGEPDGPNVEAFENEVEEGVSNDFDELTLFLVLGFLIRSATLDEVELSAVHRLIRLVEVCSLAEKR